MTSSEFSGKNLKIRTSLFLLSRHLKVLLEAWNYILIFKSSNSLAVESILAITILLLSSKCSPSLSLIGAR
jgi:hypothetical protein